MSVGDSPVVPQGTRPSMPGEDLPRDELAEGGLIDGAVAVNGVTSAVKAPRRVGVVVVRVIGSSFRCMAGSATATIGWAVVSIGWLSSSRTSSSKAVMPWRRVGSASSQSAAAVRRPRTPSGRAR